MNFLLFYSILFVIIFSFLLGDNNLGKQKNALQSVYTGFMRNSFYLAISIHLLGSHVWRIAIFILAVFLNLIWYGLWVYKKIWILQEDVWVCLAFINFPWSDFQMTTFPNSISQFSGQTRIFSFSWWQIWFLGEN